MMSSCIGCGDAVQGMGHGAWGMGHGAWGIGNCRFRCGLRCAIGTVQHWILHLVVPFSVRSRLSLPLLVPSQRRGTRVTKLAR
jgi:hypothetical protein